MPGHDFGTGKPFTGYPFGMSKTTYQQELRFLTTAQLEDLLEAIRWLAIDPDAQRESWQAYFRHQASCLLDELQRRRDLLRTNHPLSPQWNGGTLAAQRERIDSIKARMPIDTFLTHSLGCELIPRANGTYITRCPLPYHIDSSPSFHVDAAKGVGYCFGCHRGGDVISLTRWYFNTSSFAESLAALEQEIATLGL